MRKITTATVTTNNETCLSICIIYYCNDGNNNCPEPLTPYTNAAKLRQLHFILYVLIQLTALWKPLMLGVSALYVTPGRRSIPSNTALLSDIYTATLLKYYNILQELQKYHYRRTNWEWSMHNLINHKATTCGTHFGETKLVVSITDNPDWDNRFMSSILTTLGTISYNRKAQCW